MHLAFTERPLSSQPAAKHSSRVSLPCAMEVAPVGALRENEAWGNLIMSIWAGHGNGICLKNWDPSLEGSP